MPDENKKIYAPAFRDDCILNLGIEIDELLKVRKEVIAYFQPCVSEKGKLMADIELKDEKGKSLIIDPSTLCSLLEIHRRRFSSLKCSKGLGVAKFTLKGREISVFQRGKLKIQRALDKGEILKVANSVARLFWGASLCKVCGQPAIYCASGGCGRCTKKSGQVILMKDLWSSAIIVETIDNLRKAFEIASKMKDDLIFSLEGESKGVEWGTEKFENFMHRAQYLALYLVSEAPSKKDAAFGLLLIGVAREITNIYDILEKMSEKIARMNLPPPHSQATSEIASAVKLLWDAFTSALNALLDGNLHAATNIKLKNDDISKKLESVKNSLTDIDKEGRALVLDLFGEILNLQKICLSLSSLVFVDQ